MSEKFKVGEIVRFPIDQAEGNIYLRYIGRTIFHEFRTLDDMTVYNYSIMPKYLEKVTEFERIMLDGE